MTEAPENELATEVPAPENVSLLRRFRDHGKLVGGAIASIAAVGAVVGGLTGYWNAWKAVKSELGAVTNAPSSATSTAQLIVSKGPSVAVLPITNPTGGAALDALADSVTQQLTSSLGKFSVLRVAPRTVAAAFAKQNPMETGRQAGIDYIVTGDVRPVGDTVRASFQVADLHSGQEIWSRFFDANADSARTSTAGYELGDIGAAQIGGATGAILSAEYKHVQGKPVRDLSSYECIVQAIVSNALGTAPGLTRARTCLDMVVQREPANALAWAARSAILVSQRFSGFGLVGDQATSLDKRLYLNADILESATKAIELAPDDPVVRFRYAIAVSTKCEPDLFKQELEKAVALSPNDPSVLGTLGMQLAFNGDWDEGAQMGEKAIRLMGPNASFLWWYGPAKRHWWRGEYQAAYEDFRHAYVEGLFLTYLDQAYTLPFVGRLDEAKAEVAKLLKLQPAFTIREGDAYYRMYCFSSAYIEKMNGALRQSGLPE